MGESNALKTKGSMKRKFSKKKVKTEKKYTTAVGHKIREEKGQIQKFVIRKGSDQSELLSLGLARRRVRRLFGNPQLGVRGRKDSSGTGLKRVSNWRG